MSQESWVNNSEEKEEGAEGKKLHLGVGQFCLSLDRARNPWTQRPTRQPRLPHLGREPKEQRARSFRRLPQFHTEGEAPVASAETAPREGRAKEEVVKPTVRSARRAWSLFENVLPPRAFLYSFSLASFSGHYQIQVIIFLQGAASWTSLTLWGVGARNTSST